MNFENVSLIEWMTLLVAVLGLWIPVRVFSRSNNKELFQLRQTVVNKAEEARSGLYALNRENSSLIKLAQGDPSIPLEVKKMLIEFFRRSRRSFRYVDSRCKRSDQRRAAKYREL